MADDDGGRLSAPVLTLHNASFSVCSVKVRIGLAEKGLEWEDVLLVLAHGEQFDPAFLKLNPEGSVPVLVDGDLVLPESSVILEYVDALTDERPLMPTDRRARAAAKLWLLRCLEIHSAIHTLTFATVMRTRTMASRTPEQHEAAIARIPDPARAAKHRDVLERGLESHHVDAAFHALRRTFDDMAVALEGADWVSGDEFGLADVALIAYVDRLDRIGLAGLWAERAPIVGTWLEAARARPSYARATARYTSETELAGMRAAGATHWPAVRERWERFTAG